MIPPNSNYPKHTTMSDVLTNAPDDALTPDTTTNDAPVIYIAVEAIYEDGVIKPRIPLALPSGTPITLQIATRVVAMVTPFDPEQRTKLALERSEGNKEQIQAAESLETSDSGPAVAAPDTDYRPQPSPTPTTHNGRRTTDHGPWNKLEWFQAKLLPSGLLASLTRADLLLLAFGLLVYALTRFIGLNRFPIYFFSDEAIQANLAAEFLQRGLRD